MATIADELNAIAVEHGYTGAAPKTIAGAIDALADTLAGTDVKSGRTIAGAIHALAPYIGSGGGGEKLGARQLISTAYTTLYIFASDEPMTLGKPTPANAKFVVQNNLVASDINVSVPEGLYVMVLLILAESDTGTPTVVGVDDATVTSLDGRNWVVQFRMPGNEVSIKKGLS